MHYELKNNTGRDFSVLNGLIEKFFPYAQKNMGFDQPVTIVLESDVENAANPLGKTAYYSPSDNTVVLYTDNRHTKDLMRSLSHELVHHKQNCNGELSEITGEQGYAQTEVGYKIEEEAYSLGNTCFRNWEDSVKKQINETSYIIKGDKKMKLTETKLREMVKEALKNVYLKEEKTDDGGIFAPNHYCVHHGGVHHNGEIQMAEAVNHNYNEELGCVTHYDMKLQDGTILENVAFEDIQVTNASLAKEHMHGAKRDDKKKPDFPDLDGDKNKDESMEDALEDKKEKDEESVDEAGRPQSMRAGRTMADLDKEAKTRETDFLKDKKKKKEMKEEIVEAKEDNLDNWWNQSLYTNLVKKYTGGKK